MKVTLSLDFNQDHDTETTVTAKRRGKVIMHIHYNFCGGSSTCEHQIMTDVIDTDLSHLVQAKLILAGSVLIDSTITGEDAPSTVEV